MARVVFKNVYKKYSEDVIAVKDFNLDIKDEEFVVFVGPSGCGKSTSLRMLAGLEDISEGEIYIDDVLVNNVEPKNRDIAMVFQSYALYPHMSVYDNMAFALKLKKINKKEIDKRVKNAAAILGLENYLDRKPRTLSGGQRQRVALGRAIVREAKVFLMDEPLSNLDAKLRVETRAEIINLHKELKTNIIYVTHDQTEAMTMGDRIVVMKDGIIQQVDTPENIYRNPKNLFVASFIGSPQMSFFKTNLKKDGDLIILENNGNHFGEYSINEFTNLKKYNNDEIILGIRSEDITLKPQNEGDLNIKVTLVEMLGSDKYVYGLLENNKVVVRCKGNEQVTEGDIVGIEFLRENLHFFDADSGIALNYLD